MTQDISQELGYGFFGTDTLASGEISFKFLSDN
jgi:hypothetical protein